MANVTDPVCGMSIDTASAAGRASYGGQTYYFCSVECQRQFESNPSHYARSQSADSARGEELERHEPPFTKEGGMIAPKFGAAGSGGLEYERLPEAHDKE